MSEVQNLSLIEIFPMFMEFLNQNHLMSVLLDR